MFSRRVMDVRIFAIVIVGLVALVGSCSKRAEPPTSASKVTMSPNATTLAAIDPGQRTFLTYCAMCHGEWGGGDGPLASQLQREAHTLPAKLNNRERMNQLSRDELIRVSTTGGRHTRRSN